MLALDFDKTNGIVTHVYPNAQQSIFDAKITESDWKIININSEKFTKNLFIEYTKGLRGSHTYELKFVYIGTENYSVTTYNADKNINYNTIQNFDF